MAYPNPETRFVPVPFWVSFTSSKSREWIEGRFVIEKQSDVIALIKSLEAAMTLLPSPEPQENIEAAEGEFARAE